MNKIKQFIQNSCVYTVIISFLFLLFARIVQVDNAKFGISQFLIMILFGALIALANLILGYEKLHIILRIAIHYSFIFAAFLVVFIINGNLIIKGASSVFIAIVVYTIFYALFSVMAYFIKKGYTVIERKHPEKKKETKKDEAYTPKFK